MQLANKKWTLDEFMAERRGVLTAWPTGAEVDLEEGIAFQRAIPRQKRFVTRLAEAKAGRVTLVQPRAGVPLINDHITLLKHLETEGEADLLPTTIDSYTRLNRYEEAQRGIEASKASGKAMLNGFPAVNHGVAGCRMVTSALSAPVQVRHGTPDARLLCEITLAGGLPVLRAAASPTTSPMQKPPLCRKHCTTGSTATGWSACMRKRASASTGSPSGRLPAPWCRPAFQTRWR